MTQLDNIYSTKTAFVVVKFSAVLYRERSDIPQSTTRLCLSHTLGPEVTPPDHYNDSTAY